jgi:hypothetical protein
MTTFYAWEPHVDGTKQYARGDERDVENEHDVQHLVDLKVLSTKAPPKPKPDKKAEGGSDENKSEGAADQNKSA